MSIFTDIGLLPLVILAIAAVATSCVHGATGVAGGILMSVVLAFVVGVKPVVPIMSVALLISHSSRAILNIKDFHKEAYLLVAIPAIPCIILAAFLYGRMSSSLVAVVLGAMILISIPIRRWAASREIKAGKKTLTNAATAYGGLAGVSVGPGMILIPFMLGYGLTKEAFVATMAAIALTTNITRVTVYGGTNLLDMQFLVLGLLIGLLTIPGNMIGRSMLRKMTGSNHSFLVDGLTVIGALNFFWLACRQ